MKWLSFSLVLIAACATTPRALYTNGNIQMSADGVIYVTYDADPRRTVASLAGEPSYSTYLELARGLAPGQVKRIYTSNGWYSRNDDGSYVVEGLISSASGASAIARSHVSPDDPVNRCMRQLLSGAEADHRYAYLNYDRDRVAACASGGNLPQEAVGDRMTAPQAHRAS